ncbi:hypothetical protein MRX96_018551 [Rhipicephalus microplus]
MGQASLIKPTGARTGAAEARLLADNDRGEERVPEIQPPAARMLRPPCAPPFDSCQAPSATAASKSRKEVGSPSFNAIWLGLLEME